MVLFAVLHVSQRCGHGLLVAGRDWPRAAYSASPSPNHVLLLVLALLALPLMRGAYLSKQRFIH